MAKLDDVLETLRDALRSYHRNPKKLVIEPELLDDLEWFLTKYREHVKYNVERPLNRAPPNREKARAQDFDYDWEKAKREKDYPFEEIYHHAQEEMYRRVQEEMYRQAQEKMHNRGQQDAYQRGGWYGFFGDEKAQKEWQHAFGYSEPKPKQSQSQKRPWHEVLGVQPTCTRLEMMKAYRALAMRYHPDRKPDGNAKKMQEINVAKDEALGEYR